MDSGKRVWWCLSLIAMCFATGCKKEEQKPPLKEIGTFDILLDYDQENETNLAQVYRNSMDLFDDYDMSKDVLIEKTDTVSGRVIHIFAIRHYSRKAIIRFLRHVLPFIHDPRDWTFLIEGSQAEILVLPEVYFLTNVGKELDIPTIDPIVSPIGEEVTRRLVTGSPPLVNLKDIHFALFQNLFPDRQSLESLSLKTRDRYISLISEHSVLPRDSIDYLLEEYENIYLNHPLKLARDRKVYVQIRKDMIDTSNVLSRERLELLVSELPEARHLFICVGTHHLPVFDELPGLFDNIYEVHTAPGESESDKKESSPARATSQEETPEEETSTP